MCRLQTRWRRDLLHGETSWGALTWRMEGRGDPPTRVGRSASPPLGKAGTLHCFSTAFRTTQESSRELRMAALSRAPSGQSLADQAAPDTYIPLLSPPVIMAFCIFLHSEFSAYLLESPVGLSPAENKNTPSFDRCFLLSQLSPP